MSVLESLILGLVQGLTEFLPVSSSGHLVLLQRVFNISGEVVAFDVMLHAASLLAVLLVLRTDVAALVKKPLSPPALKLITATVPTVIIVLLFRSTIESLFGGSFLGFGFLLTAVLLLLTDICERYRPVVRYKPALTYRTAFVMGITQGIAVVPGISRSGSTVCAGMLSGESKESAARFSFLMSVPIIIASALVKLPELTSSAAPFAPLAVGFAAAFFSSLVSVNLMLKFFRSSPFIPFTIYLTALSILTLLNQYVFAWF